MMDFMVDIVVVLVNNVVDIVGTRTLVEAVFENVVIVVCVVEVVVYMAVVLVDSDNSVLAG